jgi:DNA transformation protein and related proteins
VPVSKGYHEYVLDQLHGLAGVTSRRMFGGVGLYSGAVFFGLINDDVLYLRVDDESRGEYEARGMEAFRPVKDKPEVMSSYYRAPVDVLEEQELLLSWARRAVEAARRAKAKPKKKAR